MQNIEYCLFLLIFSSKGLLTEGFFWIPSLGGPTTIAARQSGSGISWLLPFVVIVPYDFMTNEAYNCFVSPLMSDIYFSHVSLQFSFVNIEDF